MEHNAHVVTTVSTLALPDNIIPNRTDSLSTQFDTTHPDMPR
jgi:hypothetical protein